MKKLSALINPVILAIAAIVVIGGGLYLAQKDPAPKPETTAQQQKDNPQVKAETVKIVASLDINDGVKASHYDLTEGVGKSVLEVTQQVATVKTKGQGENAFVTSINGREADTSKREFWEMKINGSAAEVGAGSYVVQENDKIDWKISTF